MSTQPIHHKRFLISALLLLIGLVVVLAIIQPPGVDASRLRAPDEDPLEPADEEINLPFTPGDLEEWNAVQGAWEHVITNKVDSYAGDRGEFVDAYTFYRRPVADDYQFRVDVEHHGAATVGSGIVFNAPVSTTNRSGYVVRFKENGAAIEWGFIAQSDGSFQIQGEALNPLPPSSIEVSSFQNLKVRVEGNSYTILVGDVDDAVVVADSIGFDRIPTTFFGLMTSGTAGTFQNANIKVGELPALPDTPPPLATEPLASSVPSSTPLTTETPATPTPDTTPTTTATATGEADPLLTPRTEAYNLPLTDASEVADQWVTISGSWDVDGGQAGYRQTAVNSLDGIAYFKSKIDGDYRYTANFKIEEKGSPPQAGLVFNVKDRATKIGVYVIRYDGDETLEWGYFDNASTYQQIGSKVYNDGVPAPPSTDVHRIRVDVSSNIFTIEFNDTSVIDENNNVISVLFEQVLREPHPHVGLYASNAKTLFTQGEIMVEDRTTPTVTPVPTATAVATPAPICDSTLLSAGSSINPLVDQVGGEEVLWDSLSEGWARDADSTGMRQTRTDLANTMTVPGFCMDGDYAVAVDLQIDASGTAPAVGLGFNKPNRLGLPGTYAVRFDGDHLLDWGYININGAFHPVGDSVLGDELLIPDASGRHRLQVSVVEDYYTILFNGHNVTNELADGGESEVGEFKFTTLYPRVYQPYTSLYASDAASLFRDMSVVVNERTVAPTATATDAPPTNTAVSTNTPVYTSTPSNTSTPTTTRTPTLTATSTATAPDSPLATPTWTATWTATPFSVVTPTPLPTSTFLPTPTSQVPTPNMPATAAAIEQMRLAESPLATPTHTVTPMPIQTNTATAVAETATPPPAPVAIVVTATFTPTQRPIEPPTPTPTPNTLLLVATIIDSTIAMAGWIWFMFGSLLFFIVAGVLAGLSFRQQERERFDLVEPLALDLPDDDAVLDDLLNPLPPLPPLAPPDEEQPPDDWPPSLP